MALIKCKECGKEYSEWANNCPGCGYNEKNEKEQTTLIPPIERKSKYKAAVLAIFFFYSGAHEFYLRRTGIGIAWICFTLLFGILGGAGGIAFCAGIAFIEGLFLMCMNQEKFDYTFNLIKK